ncbi:craniofacial development protein 2-like protein [Plakobranchus ocellatus]|uniref:Craniofacial development protein 2-like protein n=1 Tax=Plakobranchus ocellatus TaxID=259542 RepID=A0AAV3Y5R0_9GAST|nr:craniofacial development protein 2-like protein [Plakobranchus ocellatus]
MGDFNAKVGTDKVDDIVGKHGLGIKNERVEKLIEWCQTNNIIVGNTWFQQPPKRKWTWKSPDLFSLYSEIIMRNLENHPGIKVGKQNMNNLRYADDTVLIAENKEDLQKLLNIVEEELVFWFFVYSQSTRTIRKRQATFLGHVMRKGKLEHLVTTGKFEGKRSRGRQREKIMDGLATWLGTGKVLDTLAAIKDRDLWRNMIANAYKQGT